MSDKDEYGEWTLKDRFDYIDSYLQLSAESFSVLEMQCFKSKIIISFY